MLSLDNVCDQRLRHHPLAPEDVFGARDGACVQEAVAGILRSDAVTVVMKDARHAVAAE
jgi:hypothetical protein